MEYLFSRLKKLKELLSHKFILLLLDYDGTLVKIMETPGKAVIPKETKELLQKLSRSFYCKLGIISGRSLQDIKKMIGIKNIIYSGNHGLELEGPKIKSQTQVSLEMKAVIKNIVKELQEKLSGIKGVLIEDKGFTLSIHYRRVGEKDLPVFEKIIQEVVRPYAIRDKIKVDSGKKVYEIKLPLQWDKGKIALWLMARQQFAAGEEQVLPVYIGDDATDEDAFRALKSKGITVFVGEPQDSQADYYLKDPEEVTKLLRLISDLKHN